MYFKILSLAKRQVTPVITVEKDTKVKPTTAKTTVETEATNGRVVSDAFQKMDDTRDTARSVQDTTSTQARPQDSPRHDDRTSSTRDHQEPREQNFENGRALRDSQRYRETEVPRATSAHEPESRMIEDSRIRYKSRDIYQRPIDELDTPRFPTEYTKSEPIFARIVNPIPSVKIMQVERDVEDTHDNYR